MVKKQRATAETTYTYKILFPKSESPFFAFYFTFLIIFVILISNQSDSLPADETALDSRDEHQLTVSDESEPQINKKFRIEKWLERGTRRKMEDRRRREEDKRRKKEDEKRKKEDEKRKEEADKREEEDKIREEGDKRREEEDEKRKEEDGRY
ncbi:hypothetical protein HELRODRAFT_183953 [Helobdella robusta]|uniref:Uncharacterized protein n=1 Tax=Helobdella robusta TaxID=6412 RepID=T1FKC4_HELRO|nr:hypothetical protein HELRODRAFT_183953 [Helobdella robusta]ESO09686.1 hypothetical protein HELRODRAFT_183953 [Helobdella robusta]